MAVWKLFHSWAELHFFNVTQYAVHCMKIISISLQKFREINFFSNNTYIGILSIDFTKYFSGKS